MRNYDKTKKEVDKVKYSLVGKKLFDHSMTIITIWDRYGRVINNS